MLRGESAVATKQSTEKVSSEIYFTILNKRNDSNGIGAEKGDWGEM